MSNTSKISKNITAQIELTKELQNYSSSMLLLQKIAPQAVQKNSFDQVTSYSLKDEDQNNRTLNQIINDPSNYYVYPDWLPRSPTVCQKFYEQSDYLLEKDNFQTLINDIEEDPHTKQDLARLYEILVEIGADPTCNITTTDYKSKHLICYGTGNGWLLGQLINYLNPSILTIIVSDWKELSSSFLKIDWSQIWNEYCLDEGKKINIICAESYQSVQGALSSLSLSLDHSFIFLESRPSKELLNLSKATIDKGLERAIYYIGFVMDEYNMIYNSYMSLQARPRIFHNPQATDPHGSAIICGSGPSLDKSIDAIKILSEKSLVIACASNYGTLLKAGIRVDILCLLERGDFMIEQYRDVFQQYGSNETKLFASTTTPYQLHNFFADTMVYFRPALTPLSIFAEHPDQILIHEGPQTINTGAALARVLNVKQILLFGVDLGTKSLDNVRSHSAIGESPRDFDQEVDANFGGKAYTNTALTDGRVVLESMAIDQFHPKVSLFNLSDGVKIEGWTPFSQDELIADATFIETFDRNMFESWWDTKPRYDIERFHANWLAARPRQMVYAKILALIEILESDHKWNPNVVWSVQDQLSISTGTKYEQLGSRLIRGWMIKVMIAIQRQLIILNNQPDLAKAFESQARALLVQRLKKLNCEIMQLFDALETNYS